VIDSNAMNETHSPSVDTADGVGPLTRKVLEFDRTMKRLVAELKDAADWAPLTEFVAVGEFKRVGTFLEMQNWNEYTEMLTRWASVRRISEIGAVVYYEIEERHFRGGNVNVVNSMTVFGFDVHDKIRRLRVYLQQAR
jgi:hypothetical protein